MAPQAPSWTCTAEHYIVDFNAVYCTSTHWIYIEVLITPQSARESPSDLACYISFSMKWAMAVNTSTCGGLADIYLVLQARIIQHH